MSKLTLTKELPDGTEIAFEITENDLDKLIKERVRKSDTDSVLKRHDAVQSELDNINQRIKENSLMEIPDAIRQSLKDIWDVARLEQNKRIRKIADRHETLDQLKSKL